MIVMADTSLRCELHVLLYMHTRVSGVPIVLFVDNKYREQLVDLITSQSMYN